MHNKSDQMYYSIYWLWICSHVDCVNIPCKILRFISVNIMQCFIVRVCYSFVYETKLNKYFYHLNCLFVESSFLWTETCDCFMLRSLSLITIWRQMYDCIQLDPNIQLDVGLQWNTCGWKGFSLSNESLMKLPYADFNWLPMHGKESLSCLKAF